MLEGENLDLGRLQKIENEIDDLMLPYKMDVSLLKHIRNDDLLEHIQRVGIVFYENDRSSSLCADNFNLGKKYELLWA